MKPPDFRNERKPPDFRNLKVGRYVIGSYLVCYTSNLPQILAAQKKSQKKLSLTPHPPP